jgi:aryl-alcohol dehydrogenase-like predicted oxidoreductase
MSDANSGRPVSGGEYSLAGRRVARIGFGTGQLSRLTGDADAAIAIVRRAVELGVNHIDTAQFYGAGFANEVLRIALRPDDGVLVATKVGADPDPDGPVPLKTAQRPEQLRASVEDNLRSLSVERLELVNLRRLDVGPGVRASGEQVVDLDDQLAEMVAMRDEGLIGAIGISAVSLDGLRRALPARVVCVQNAYSLASRAYEDLLELCVAEGLAWVPFYPLGGTFASMPKVVEQPAVVEIAAWLGATPSQVGLAWLLGHAPNTLLIPGTSSIAHLEQNLTIGELELDAEATAALDAVADPGGEPIPFFSWP